MALPAPKKPACAPTRSGRSALGAALTLLLVGGAANAQTADLLTALKAARDTDPTIRAARATLDMALLKVPEARATLLPTLGISGSHNVTKASTAFSGLQAIDRSGSTNAITLQLVQPLFRVDSVLANNQATLIVESAQAQYDQATQDLLLRVASAYFAFNEATEARLDADAQVAAMDRQLLEVSKGYDAGTRAITDVDDTRARLGAARAQRIAAQGDIESARSDLERLTGVRYATLSALPDTVGLPSPDPANVGDWIDRARENNLQVRALQAGLAVADLDVSRARTGHLPTMDLVANVGRNRSSHSLTTPDDYSTRAAQREIGLQVNIPLFAGGAVTARVNQAFAALEKARADLDAAKRDAADATQHAFNGVLTQLAQVEALQLSVDASDRALKGNREGFRVGYRTNVDVLNAEQQLFNAHSGRCKARYEAILQGLKLKAAGGILNERDLETVAKLMR